MSWEQFGDDKFKSSGAEKTKDITVGGGGNNYFYCVYRIGKSYKTIDGNMNQTINGIRYFEKHMERKMEVPNANFEIKNEILIGSGDIRGIVKEYIKDIKLRKDGVVAKELLMTASPDFFRGMMPGELQKWKDDNVKFLKDNFGDNCVYATCHNDEKTVHIHALIVSKFYNEKRKIYTLANKRYFGGREKLREWQDNYSNAMQEHFKILHRGVKYSKAKHMQIKQFYSLLKQNVDEKSIEQLTAKVKNSQLLEIKMKAIQKTLETYKKYSNKNDLALQDAKLLLKQIDKFKDDKDIYKEVVSLLSQQYRIPQYAIKECIKQCENIKINDEENER